MAAYPAKKDLGIPKSLLSSNPRSRQDWLGKALHLHLRLHGSCIRSMATGSRFTGRRKTGNSIGHRSATPPLRTGSFIVFGNISSQYMITFTESCWNVNLQWQTRHGSRYWMRKGGGPKHNLSCGFFTVVRMCAQHSSCMAIPQPGAAEGYSGYLKTDEYQGYNTLTGSNAVPVGYISGGTLLMLFLKGKRMTTARLQWV